VALLLGLAGVVAVAAASQAADAGAARSRTLTFDVVFSSFSPIAANNDRVPNPPFALGNEIVFHDQLFSNGKHVGDELGSCVVVALTPELLANCSDVIRLPGGNLTAQFPSVPDPAPKELALTGGTGSYRNGHCPSSGVAWRVRLPQVRSGGEFGQSGQVRSGSGRWNDQENDQLALGVP
jgi:hypothetical protein